MKLTKLNLTNYRNFESFGMKLKRVNVLVAQNGQGKTNLLEAIRFLSVMKPFRATRDSEVIKWESDFARINGLVEAKENKSNIVIALNRQYKKVAINKIEKPISLAVGQFKTVLFAPDDSDFIVASPSGRRRFIDILVSQRDAIYLANLVEFRKVIRQRNATLEMLGRGLIKTEMLAIWNEKLIELSDKIQKSRTEAIDQLNHNLSDWYQVISGERQPLEVIYTPSKISEEILNNIYQKELRYRISLQGAHRDDLSVILAGYSLELYGSRGERRSALLAIKRAEMDYLTSDDELPVLLIDDITSELDEKRQSLLLDLLEGFQVIVTATVLKENLAKKADNIIQLGENE